MGEEQNKQCGWGGCPGPAEAHEVVSVYRSNSGETWGVTVNSHWLARMGWVSTAGKGGAYYNADLPKAVAYAERRVAAINTWGVAVLRLSHHAERVLAEAASEARP